MKQTKCIVTWTLTAEHGNLYFCDNLNLGCILQIIAERPSPIMDIFKTGRSLKMLEAKPRKYQGAFEVKNRVKTCQVRGIWSQQLEHKQVPQWGTEPGVRKGKCPPRMNVIHCSPPVCAFQNRIFLEHPSAISCCYVLFWPLCTWIDKLCDWECYRSQRKLTSTMKHWWLYMTLLSLTIFEWKIRNLKLNWIYLFCSVYQHHTHLVYKRHKLQISRSMRKPTTLTDVIICWNDVTNSREKFLSCSVSMVHVYFHSL